jgi:TonB family protein
VTIETPPFFGLILRKNERTRQYIERRIVVLILLFGIAFWLTDATAAEHPRAAKCRTPPQLIPTTQSEYPTSTARPPQGTVVMEFTVDTTGTVRDIEVIGQVDGRLQQWAIDKSRELRFVPVREACRTRFTITSKVSDELPK